MRKFLTAIALMAIAGTAYAACSTHTIFSGGRYLTCTTCCDSWGNCNTTCF